jgi:predicted dinucleotide-binding enzyme
MNIGIIGSGNVAQSLGKALADLGYVVMLGSRDPNKQDLVVWKDKVGKNGKLGTTTEAANFGEIVILAFAWHAYEYVIENVHSKLVGKIVIDVTNPLVFQKGSAPGLAVGHNSSGGEIIQKKLNNSQVVKALNIVNHARMANPTYSSGTPIMFLCGNHGAANKRVYELLEEFGWKDIVDLGGIEKSRLLEPLCVLWVEYGMARNTWNHAFSVLDK